MIEIHPEAGLPTGGAPAPRPASGVRRALLGGAAAVAVAGVAGTAWAAASFLSGGGTQPEDVLPAGAVAMAKVDLDPAAGQKLAVFRLTQRFPSTQDDVSSADAVRDELLRAVFESGDVDYGRDVASWVGDRAAVALVPVPGEEPAPLVAVAHTGRDEADAALRRLSEGDDPLHWAFSEAADYVLIAGSQEVVDAAAGGGDVLADDARFRDDLERLDGDQVVTAWADVDGIWQALPEEDRELLAPDPELVPSGRLVVGAHATDDGVEVVGRAVGLSTGSAAEVVAGVEPGTGMVGDLPADAVAALSVTDLGAAVDGALGGLLGAGDPFGIGALAEEAGLVLPDDLEALFGDETVGAVFTRDDVAARSRGGEPDRALEVVELLVGQALADEEEVYVEEPFGEELYGEGYPDEQHLDEGYADEGYLDETYPGDLPPEPVPALPPPPPAGPAPGLAPTPPGLVPPPPGEAPVVVDGAVGRSLGELPAEQLRRLDDGIAVGTSGRAVDLVTSGDGGLGRSAAFRRAVADPRAGAVLFVDVARAVELFLASGDDADLAVLEAVGLSATGGADAAFTARLTVR